MVSVPLHGAAHEHAKDQACRLIEDHTRKLLWTFGQDPHFKETGSRQAIRVTPSNFPRVCDRFGILRP